MRLLCFEIKYVGFHTALDRELLDLMRADLNVNAVKLYRNETGSTLKDAVDYCKALKLKKLGKVW